MAHEGSNPEDEYFHREDQERIRKLKEKMEAEKAEAEPAPAPSLRRRPNGHGPAHAARCAGCRATRWRGGAPAARPLSAASAESSPARR